MITNYFFNEEAAFIKLIKAFPNESIIKKGKKIIIGLVEMKSTPVLVDLIGKLRYDLGIMKSISMTEDAFELICMPRDADLNKLLK